MSSSSTSSAAICATGLRKSYDDHVVLDGIDLAVPEGTVYALLGPNGSGKTTAVRILSTLVPADGGVAFVAGHDVAVDPGAVRRAIGVTGQFSAVDDLLTGAENLRLIAALHHLPREEVRRRVAELLDRFELSAAADRRVATWSGGMRRRLDLAMTLVAEPRLLFLDEPTTGLDPRSRRQLWRIVQELVAGGVTVLLTTQYLEEADQLADRVALLDGGRLVAEGTPAQLKARVPGATVQLRFSDSVRLAAAATVLPGATRNDEALTLTVPGDGTPRALRQLLDALPDEDGVTDVALHAPTLDDVFLALTGGVGAEQQEAAR